MTEEHVRTLAQHEPDGELYIVEYGATWDGDRISTGPILAAVGPINRAEFEPIEPSQRIWDQLAFWDLSSDDTEWLNDEEAAGRLRYIIGARC